jgi:hypothetical protein
MNSTSNKSIDTIRKIKETILNQIQEGNDYPYYYSVIQFGFYGNDGIKLPINEIRKFYDKYEVHKTCKLIYNMLKETFRMDGLWFFIERHADMLDEAGEILRKGRFHINIISSSIKDSVVEEPSRKVRRLMLENGRFDIPIEDNVYKDLDELKIELFNACCRRANWINRYKHSIVTQMLDEPTDLESAVYYCLKDYDAKSDIDFSDIVVFQASDFYKP